MAAVSGGDWAGYTELTAAASAVSNSGLMITLNGAYSSTGSYEAYIAEITINDEPVDPYSVSGSGVSLVDPPSD